MKPLTYSQLLESTPGDVFKSIVYFDGLAIEDSSGNIITNSDVIQNNIDPYNDQGYLAYDL